MRREVELPEKKSREGSGPSQKGLERGLKRKLKEKKTEVAMARTARRRRNSALVGKRVSGGSRSDGEELG